MSKPTKEDLSGYFIFKFQELLDSDRGLEFSDYVAVGGLLELSRQYNSMPLGIKELSAQGLKDSISNIIDKHGTLLKYKDVLPQKELKEFLLNLYLISRSKKEKYFEKLFLYLSDSKTYIGILKAIKYIIDKIEEENRLKIDTKDIYNVLNDLMFLLIEYIDYKGHTLSVVHRTCQQMTKEDSNYDLFNKIYQYIKDITLKKTSNFEKTDFKLIIHCNQEHKEFLESYLEKIIKDINVNEKIKRITLDKTEAMDVEDTDKIIIIKSYFIFNLDEIYMERINRDIYIKIDDFITRTKYKDIHVNIYKTKNVKSQLVRKSGKTKYIQLNIKYFNQYWKSEKFLKISDYRYEEVNKINEWIKIIENSPKNQISYNALWSILEFLLIDNIHDNKIDTIVKNLFPYMGLFYFRKSLKTSFRKIINYYKDDMEAGQIELTDCVINTINLKYGDFKSVADAYLLYIFDKNYKNKWWDGLTFEKCSNSFIKFETMKLHEQLHEPTKIFERFESIVKNDLKQMYRLRNMSAHSGITDNRILINTYDRLKYYVETLLNAISFVWLEQFNNSETVFDINDLKRVDWEDYKNKCKSFAKDGEQGILQLVNYNGLIKIPPNKFSFLTNEMI